MPGEGQSFAERSKVMERAAARWQKHSGREHLILASNRGPLEYSYNGDGIPEAHQGAGGVVSGLLCGARHRPVTWIALAMTDADRAVARAGMELGSPLVGDVDLPDIEVRLIDVSRDAYRRHYLGISNHILWFAQHYLLSPAQTSIFGRKVAADWREGYVVANRAIADAVLDALRVRGKRTPVLFQDYHLYLAPAMVRAACPEARLGHFVHIPWPDARYWDMLPEYIVRAIYEGLAANDVVGFHTVRDAHNFLLGAERYLRDARLQWEPSGQSGALVWANRRSDVRAFPIAVTSEEVERCADSPAARREAFKVHQRIMRDAPDHRLIVRVDRLEPTKNIVRGFQAYERLLKRYPEWQGKVTFLALLVPSRQELAAYQRYERQVCSQIERINARYGRPGWQPIVYIFENNRPCALALMRHYHVLLVNPVIDGMNLVVKEGGLLNKQDGVIVLSRTAGAYEQLGDHVLGIHPMDVDQTAEALRQALEMPVRKRAAHASALRDVLLGESADAWLDAQVEHLTGSRQKVAVHASAAQPVAQPIAEAIEAATRSLAHPQPPAAVTARPAWVRPPWEGDLPIAHVPADEDAATLPV